MFDLSKLEQAFSTGKRPRLGKSRHEGNLTEAGDKRGSSNASGGTESTPFASYALQQCTAPKSLGPDAHNRRIMSWISGGYWISITFKEAKHLGAYDYETKSSDPYAKMRLTLPGEKAPVITEHRTRTVHRNLCPMFEERLLCPLSGLSPACMFYLILYDADWLRAEFMGQVKSTLGQLLEHTECAGQPVQQWYSLMGKSRRPKGNHEGDVLLEVQLLTYSQAEQVRRVQEKYRRPEFLEARFSTCQLEVSMRSIRFMRRVRDARALQRLISNLAIEVRVGQSMMRQPMSARVLTGQQDEKPIELELEETICMPLQNAFNGNWLLWDRKATAEVADIKMSICMGSEQLFKTQVPLWAVPVQDEEDIREAQQAREKEGEDDEHDPDSLKSSHKSSVYHNLLAQVHSMSLLHGRSTDEEQGPHKSSRLSSHNLPEPADQPPAEQINWKTNHASQQQCPELVLMACDCKHPLAFSRPMEQYAKNTPLPDCQMEFTMNVMPRKVAEDLSPSPSSPQQNCKCTVLDIAEDQEDERDAPPLKSVPEPLETMVSESTFPCGPCKLYQLLFKAGSELAAEVAKKEGLTNVQVGPWGTLGCEDGVSARRRTIKYTKPLSIPLPFAPKVADVTEVHTLRIKEVSGWVLMIEISTEAPKGDTFKVINQVVGIRGATAESSNLRVSMTVEFLKNVGLLKSTISGGAFKDTVKHWKEEVASALNAHLGSSISARPDEEGTQVAAPPPVAQAPPPQKRTPVLCVPNVCVMMLMLAVFLLIAIVLSGRQAMVLVMQRLAEAINALAAAQEQLAELHHHPPTVYMTCPTPPSTADNQSGYSERTAADTAADAVGAV